MRKPETPFYVRTSEVRSRPGSWSSTLVEIFMDDVKIGEYQRSYPSFASTTFEPFKVGDSWFALYSANYTCTRIMSLPDCKDIGGEEADTWGFCPVELYVPHYRKQSFMMALSVRKGEVVEREMVPYEGVLWPWEQEEIQEVEEKVAIGSLDDSGAPYALSDWTWCPFGFVAGCIWGDDSSWKIEFLDLARAAEGILERSDRFGYAELPNNLDLRQAVDMNRWDPYDNGHRIGIAATQWFDPRPGREEAA